MCSIQCEWRHDTKWLISGWLGSAHLTEHCEICLTLIPLVPETKSFDLETSSKNLTSLTHLVTCGKRLMLLIFRIWKFVWQVPLVPNTLLTLTNPSTQHGHLSWAHECGWPCTALFLWEWGSEIQSKCPHLLPLLLPPPPSVHRVCVCEYKNGRGCMSCGNPGALWAVYEAPLWPFSTVLASPPTSRLPSPRCREFVVTSPSNCLKQDYDSHTGCERVQNKSACQIPLGDIWSVVFELQSKSSKEE